MQTKKDHSIQNSKLNYDRQLAISAAGSRNSKEWATQVLNWSDLVNKLSNPVKSTETLADYLTLPKRKQDSLKDVGGFVGGELRENKRRKGHVIGRDLLTLDLDNIPKSELNNVYTKLTELQCSYVAHGTRKHSPDKPRLRIIIPFDRTATADEYGAVAHKIAAFIGMKYVDSTTFEAERVMFWPSCSHDSEFVFKQSDGPFLSVEETLTQYDNWRDMQEWPQVPGKEINYQRESKKQGEPTEKPGVIGAFCRQYDIHNAIETFLPGVYEQTGQGDRYTFTNGSTVGGAVTYEGKFLYSHHATDPCGGKLVNSFDLVRLHLFSDEDVNAKSNTPVNRLPSFKAMSNFALNEAGISNLINKERYESAIEDFREVGGLQQELKEDDKEWLQKLKINFNTGQPLKTIENILIALTNDPYLKGRIKLDEFEGSLLGVAPLPWAPRNEQTGVFRWEDEDDSGLLIYLEKILQFQNMNSMAHALNQCAAKNRFNPVTDYLNSLQWDGVQRLDTLFIDYLGAEDTPYTRAVARKSFTAAVARAMVPGIKHDTMPVLNGAQGLGKTTLIQKMGKSRFSNSLETFEGKDAAEMLQGQWLVEIAEMSAYNRSDVNSIKGFLSRTEDHYRAAYARTAKKHPRKCVFFGTSNRSDYLKDSTGGRRFWPVDVGVQEITKSIFNDLDNEVDQLWAEAVMYWNQKEQLFLTGELEEEAKRQQEGHQEQDPKEGLIREFVARKVPTDWNSRSIEDRKLYWNFADTEVKENAELVERDRICAAEIWVECFDEKVQRMKRAESIAINDILGNLDGWEKKKNPARYGPYGSVKGGYFRK